MSTVSTHSPSERSWPCLSASARPSESGAKWGGEGQMAEISTHSGRLEESEREVKERRENRRKRWRTIDQVRNSSLTHTHTQAKVNMLKEKCGIFQTKPRFLNSEVQNFIKYICFLCKDYSVRQGYKIQCSSGQPNVNSPFHRNLKLYCNCLVTWTRLTAVQHLCVFD